MTDNHQLACRRTSARKRVHGVVALTNSGDIPLITRINDIGPGGVSFLHTDDRGRTEDEIQMDIIIFDGKGDNDCFLSGITGRLKALHIIVEPRTQKPVWRYSVEFTKLNAMQIYTLQSYMEQRRKKIHSLSCQPMCL